MIPFDVWIRPQGDFCQVQVEGIDNARWLLERLSRFFIFQTAEGVIERMSSPICMFLIPYNPPFSHRQFEKILRAIPEVTLMYGREHTGAAPMERE